MDQYNKTGIFWNINSGGQNKHKSWYTKIEAYILDYDYNEKNEHEWKICRIMLHADVCIVFYIHVI